MPGEPGHPYVVRWHPVAETERETVRPAGEIQAMWHAIEKLMSEGATLRFPHSSGVVASPLDGLRELRPRAGRSRWRPLYIQVAKSELLVLAVAPEAQSDQRGFRIAVAGAAARWEALLAHDQRRGR